MKQYKTASFLLILFLATLSAISQEKNDIAKQPNVIIFLVDDMGWQDTSLPFYKEKTKWNAIYHTPNMEKLASQGMKFTHAYAAAVCTPSRVSLLTGMNPINHKVTNWTFQKNKSEEGESAVVSVPKWNLNGLSSEPGIDNTIYATTLPSILKQNGYTTISIGKAHFGAYNTPGENPLNLGFDINIGGHAAGQPKSYLGIENFGNEPEKEDNRAVPGLKKYWGKDIFLTEALTEEAISLMDSVTNSKKPFFLYMSHYAIHTPIMADNRFIKKYTDAGLAPIEAKYASLIEGMDKSLGDIMTYLKENKIDKNTIIIFLSDNGGLSAHTREGVPLNTHNTPLRSGKGSAYEGGVRIPFIVKWPGITPANTVSANNISIEDIFPTVLALTGNKSKHEVQKLDGQSLVPLLKQQKVKNNSFYYWHYPHVWGPEGPALKLFSAIRQGDWKLIYFHEDLHFELYNTNTDIGEQNNVVKVYPKIGKKLANQLGRFLRKANTNMPINKRTKRAILFPDEAFNL